LISDKDGAGLKIDGNIDTRKQKKYERHLKLVEKLDDRYYCLNCREIENTLSPSILEATVRIFEKNNFENVTLKNWRYAYYKDMKIGNFLNSNVVGASRNYASSSGTINEKVKFCKRAVESIRSIDDLSEEAKDLSERIYKFIREQNSANI